MTTFMNVQNWSLTSSTETVAQAPATITVADATQLPDAPFRVVVWRSGKGSPYQDLHRKIFAVTDVTGNVLTVTAVSGDATVLPIGSAVGVHVLAEDLQDVHTAITAAEGHNHTGVYEPANANIQTHIGITAGNPHGTTAGDVGAAPALHGHDLTYAPLAEGVTNGDSHDHSGGDGAQIAYATLSGTPDLSSLHTRGHAVASALDHTDWPADLTAAELAHVHGVTSAIQTQLNGKSAAGHDHTGVYEPANANIQTHIGITAGNPHGTTAGDVGAAPALHGHDLTYAPLAEGVTNGDTHDHNGGDGGQIDHGDLLNLASDDHLQYHTDARGDARYSLVGHGHTAPVVVTLLPADAIIPASGGPTLTKTAGTYVVYQTLDYADAVTQTAYWQFAVPAGYDGSAIAARTYWLLPAAVDATVRLNVDARCVSNDDLLDGAARLPTGIGGTRGYGAAGYSAGDVHGLGWNWASNLPLASQLVIFSVGRAGGNAADTLDGQLAKFLALRLTFNCTI